MKKTDIPKFVMMAKIVPFVHNQPTLYSDEPLIGLSFMVLRLFFYAVIAIAVISIPWSALLYVTSGGDGDRMSEGGSKLWGAILSIVGSIGALYLIQILGRYFGRM